MNLSLALVLCFLIVNAAAGGVRGAYERIFIWYAYQAEIEYLTEKDGNLNNLRICPTEYGSGPQGTLTFNEFIEYTNREGNSKGPIPQILRPGQELNVDRVANAMWKRQPEWLKSRWPRPQNMHINGPSYNDLLKEIANEVDKFKGTLGTNNKNIQAATRAVDLVEKTRLVDYEKYRIPELLKSPDFTGENKVNWVFDNYQFSGMSNPKAINMEATEEENPGKDVKNRVSNWEQSVYFNSKDLEENEVRKGHKNAWFQSYKVANFVVTGQRC